MKGLDEFQTISDYASEYVYEYDKDFDKRNFEESNQIVREVLSAFSFIIDKIRLGYEKINGLFLYYLVFDLPYKPSKEKMFIKKEEYDMLLKVGVKEVKE